MGKINSQKLLEKIEGIGLMFLIIFIVIGILLIINL